MFSREGLVNYGADITIAAGHPEIKVERSTKIGGVQVVKIDNTETGRGYTFTDAQERGVHATNGWGSAGYLQPADGAQHMLGKLIRVSPNGNTGINVA